MSSRMPARIAAVCAASTAMIVALAAPAMAHTEITIDNPQAGATNVTMTMDAEAESESAGIAAIRVVLPDGLPAAQVALAEAPAGWALTPTADGFTVAGGPLLRHTDAHLTLRIAQLPATASVLVFKTLVNYADGGVDRWIEAPTAQNPNPEHPAPTVSLRPAAQAGNPPAASSAAPVSAPASTPSLSAAAAPSPAADTGSNAGQLAAWLAVAVVLLAAAAVGAVLVRRRRATGT